MNNKRVTALFIGATMLYAVATASVLYHSGTELHKLKSVPSDTEKVEKESSEYQGTVKNANDLWSSEDLAKAQANGTDGASTFKIENEYEDISKIPNKSPNLVDSIGKKQVYLTVDSEDSDINPVVYDERDGDEYEFLVSSISSAETLSETKSKQKGSGRVFTPFDSTGYYLKLSTPEYMKKGTTMLNGYNIVDWSTPQSVFFGGFGDDSEQVKEARVAINTSYFYESDYLREVTKLVSISRTYSGSEEDDELQDSLLVPLDFKDKGKTVYVQSSEQGLLQGVYVPMANNRLVHISIQGSDLPSRKEIVSALISMLDTSEIVDSSKYVSTSNSSTVLGSRVTDKGTDTGCFFSPTNEWIDSLLSLDSDDSDLKVRKLDSSSSLTALGMGADDKVLLGTDSDKAISNLVIDNKNLRVLSAYHYTRKEDFEDPYEVLTRNNIRKTIPLYYKWYKLSSGERLLVGTDQLTDKILFGWLLSKDENECTSIYFGDREGSLYEDKGKGTSYLLNNDKEDLGLLLSLLTGRTKGAQ